ncbi:MAG: hypothetical protein PHI64_12880 [Zoogloea sp.]|uniref:hypothetical protein n=1 Tax=Zoogloea sp. TaxID=49181 RepID=UPI00261F67A6|nr:hypothetical protein [Zoogloea sp.]MDD2989843.1 hypothetical protein [Zoogloea sp.]
MTIESTFDRIATALEKQNELLSALLERALINSPAEVAEAPKARGRKKAEDVAAPQPETPVPETPVNTEQGTVPAASEPAAAQPAAAQPAAGVPSVEEVQSFATALAARVTPVRVIELIKKQGTSNISTMSDEKRAAFWADIQALDAEISTANALS